MTPDRRIATGQDPMRLHVLLEADEEGGYTGQCVEIPAAIAAGSTRDEALRNTQEAIEHVIASRRAEAQAIVQEADGPSHQLVPVEVEGVPGWMRR